MLYTSLFTKYHLVITVTSSKPSLITELECTNCGKKYQENKINTLCDSCGKVLYARYDLEQAKETLTKEAIQKRKVYNIWRWHEIMPVKEEKHRITLGEGWTPLVRVDNFGKKNDLSNVFIKDEGQNPTGTFKSRGLCAAVAKALELGKKEDNMDRIIELAEKAAEESNLEGLKLIATNYPMIAAKLLDKIKLTEQMLDSLASEDLIQLYSRTKKHINFDIRKYKNARSYEYVTRYVTRCVLMYSCCGAVAVFIRVRLSF